MARCIASTTAEGGIVSITPEVMTFVKALFTGHFFRRENAHVLAQWNRICFSGQFDFGLGPEKKWFSWFMSSVDPIGQQLGSWDQSGASAFHGPQRDVFVNGTVNQAGGFGRGAGVSAIPSVMKATK